VGFVRIIDQDVVDLTNLHRQYLYDSDSLGFPKVEIAQRRLKALNPNVEVEALPLTVTQDSAEEVVKGVDVVVDALDRFAPRYAINTACVRNKIPYIYAGVLGTYGNVSTIVPGETACLECVVGKVEDGTLPTCETAGVFPPTISIVASIQVREATYLLLGKKPQLMNKLFFVDTHSFEFESFDIVRRPDCNTCGKPSVARAPSVQTRPSTQDPKIAELCGKESYMISPKSMMTIELDKATDRIDREFKIKVRSTFGLTFDYSEKISVSLMKTGNMLIKGAKDRDEALQVYGRIMNMLDTASLIS
jgi:adenylyltransferase/sulfurtransferase